MIELLKVAKEKNIHTTLDTSGILFNKTNTAKYDELIKYTDLVMLDIKHIDSAQHHKLTGQINTNVLEFAKYLSDNKVSVWIRHVVVPNITFNKTHLMKLGEFLSTLSNIQALDVLPYHDMAVPKYENLGKEYPLKNVPALTKEQALEARNIIIEAMRSAKLKKQH